jgi:hypothetical protein
VSDIERTTDSALARLYRDKRGLAAFVDETYPNNSAQQRQFYLFTAVIIPTDEVDLVRSHYAQIAGGVRWHTTERAKDEDHEAIRDFVDYLAEHPDPLIVVLETDQDVMKLGRENARRHSFMALARILHEIHHVDLLVYERRRPGLEQKLDDASAAAVRVALPALVVYDAGAKAEPLLAGPDVIAWTLRRRIIAKDSWFDPFIGVVKIYGPNGSERAGMAKIGRLNETALGGRS